VYLNRPGRHEQPALPYRLTLWHKET